MGKSLEDRFWPKVDRRGPNDCWEWTGAKTNRGYGNIWTGRGFGVASRVSYELHNGPIDDGLVVCHSCDNRGCVNPAHLFAGTHDENMRDMASKGRSLRGERHNMCRLTEDDVIEIKRLIAEGQTQAKIAEAFGVAPGHISNIALGKRWAYI